MSKGLFDLSFMESTDENDALDLKVEDAEFKDHCPSMDPEQHFDKDNSGNHEIPVPGGDKETPTAKPADGANMGPSTPGGDKETPSTKPADGANMGPPINSSKVTIDSSEYNDALAQLQRSFKEGYEILDMIRNAEVTQETVEERQKRFAENAMFEAAVDSYLYGPMFESVTNSDRKAIGEIVKNLRDDIAEAISEQGIKFKKIHPVLRSIAIFSPRDFASGTQILNHDLLFQILGVCYIEDGNVSVLMKTINDKFSKELGKYKVLPVSIIPGLLDLISSGSKYNNKKTYLLIIDKKLPAEMDDMQEELVALAKEKKDKKDKKNNDKKN